MALKSITTPPPARIIQHPALARDKAGTIYLVSTEQSPQQPPWATQPGTVHATVIACPAGTLIGTSRPMPTRELEFVEPGTSVTLTQGA